MFELKKPEKLEVKIYGDVYQISPLTVKKRDEVIEQYSDLDQEDQKALSNFAKSFVEKMGIPVKKLEDELLAEDFDLLFKMLVGLDKQKK